MQFLSSWASEDCRRLVHFKPEVLDVFTQHIQRTESDCEAGGLLLGTVHGEHMMIEQATTPTEQDRRFRCLFERMPFGHAAVASALWLKSAGRVRHLGEWHTHPEDDPTPSGLDRSEWKRLSGQRKDGRPLLTVIVGRSDLRVEIVPKATTSYRLHGIE